ncbi:MAG: glycogen debranching protein GlgX [Myxococcaceae bacterium]|nr:glycogen debranching protein GlgX [Myxococcaceae bacterium]
MTFPLRPGVPYPLGATFDGHGVNFAVLSSGTGIDLCLFDEDGVEHRAPLTEVTNGVWHGYVPGLRPGQAYGFRAHGPWNPGEGFIFNPSKLLVDPYARALKGQVTHTGPLSPFQGAAPDPRDSAPFVPRSLVVRDDFDWAHEKRPEVIWRRTVIYEVYLKGLTARHPEVPPEHRGTYLGLAHPAVIEHLRTIGVTSVELLPVQHSVVEGFLVAKGLTNAWGYNTLGFFAPDPRFASATGRGAVHEFKTMVKALHHAGLEVILDVAPNHTCEGNHLGPMLSWKGLDNRGSYWLQDADRSKYRDFTGCGNSLNLGNPWVLKLVLDSLRHWVTEFHVDGFRFDLATTLARSGNGDFQPNAPFLTAIHQDPVLSRVKLIAEPWDLGHEGYRLGQYPALFAEWNDRYRDSIRHFWKGDQWQASELGYRLTGSSDFFKLSGRRPTASINFLAAHDGFTLRDLVSYSKKHNDANLEGNKDGNDSNHSWNCGVEGETTDAAINTLRARQQRNFLATLFLSVGTPMLNAGDELGRTQRGNNNTYCQDNELLWHDWKLTPEGAAHLAFVRRLAELRRHQPVLQRRNFFLGQTLDDSKFHDLVWFNADGAEMQPADWKAARQYMAWFLGGDAIGTRDPEGRKLVGDSLLIYLNASADDLPVTLPGKQWGARWQVSLDTALELEGKEYACGARFVVMGRSVVVLAMRAGAPA